MSSMFPYLNINISEDAGLETVDAGYLNPRRLIEAQQTIAKRSGCEIIDDTVSSVRRVIASDNSYCMQVLTEGSRQILCRKVLLATGAFTTFRDLLPASAGFPDQELTPTSVSLLRVSEADAEQLRLLLFCVYTISFNNSTDIYILVYRQVPQPHC